MTDKGTYLLLMHLPTEQDIAIGKLGQIKFKSGFYIYVGSALNSLSKRIKRHLRTNKKLFWHIDYITQYFDEISAFIKENDFKEECLIAERFIDKFECIKDFGSSDCNCKSHLFYSKNLDKLIKFVTLLKFNQFQSFNAGIIKYQR